jgi:acyl-CoA thioester hydrolase
MAGLLRLHRERVQPGWIDYNGHLLDAYYLLIFSNNTTTFMEHIGLGAKERAEKGHSLFTLEVHLNYLHEIIVGQETWVDIQLLGHDAKRLHVFYTLYAEDSPQPRATSEQMLMNIDMNLRKSVPFLPEVQARIEAIAREQADLPRPANVGRIIALPRK